MVLDSKFDKTVVYTTTVLFLDVLVGRALTDKPLHESVGAHFPDYLQNIEDLALVGGWFYTCFTYVKSKDPK